jgi:hypothetical protein
MWKRALTLAIDKVRYPNYPRFVHKRSFVVPSTKEEAGKAISTYFLIVTPKVRKYRNLLDKEAGKMKCNSHRKRESGRLLRLTLI